MHVVADERSDGDLFEVEVDEHEPGFFEFGEGVVDLLPGEAGGAGPASGGVVEGADEADFRG